MYGEYYYSEEPYSGSALTETPTPEFEDDWVDVDCATETEWTEVDC